MDPVVRPKRSGSAQPYAKETGLFICKLCFGKNKISSERISVVRKFDK